MPIDASIPMRTIVPQAPNILGMAQQIEQLKNLKANRQLRTRKEKTRERLGDLYGQYDGDLRMMAGRIGPTDPQVALDLNNMADKRDYQDAQIEKMRQLAQADPTAQAGYGKRVVWGMGEDGKPAAMRTAPKGLELLSMPKGVSELTPGVQKIDLGDKWGIMDKRGTLIGYQAKGIAPEQQPTFKKKQAKSAAEGKIEAGVEAGTVVPKAEQTLAAKKDLSSSLVRMKGLYDDLREAGGITDTEATGLSNLGAWAKSTGIGQGIQKILGTKEQSIRNEIKAIKPTLINAVRKASEMGAKGMDSEKELEFFLQTVTDETKDFQSNIAAIAALDRSLGLDMGMQITPQLEAKIAEIHAEYARRKAKFGPVKKPNTRVDSANGKKKDDPIMKKYNF